MNKKTLRSIYKKLRNELTEDLIDVYSLNIANQLLKLPIWDKTYFHLFLSIKEKNEVNTSFILNILQGRDKDVIISKSNFETGEMIHFLLTDNTTIKKNDYNIPEPIDGIKVPPSKIEVVFVPLLVFDREGNRIGYGKGFYDRFLSNCNKDVIKVGVSFFEAEEKIEDTGNFDIPLDFCITPNYIYAFRAHPSQSENH